MKLILNYLKRRGFLVLQITSLILTVAFSAFTAIVPGLNGQLVDDFIANGEINTQLRDVILIFVGLSLIFNFVQLIVSSFIAERVGFLIRNDLIKKITSQTYEFVSKITTSKLLTNLTGDIQVIKDFLANNLNLLITSFTIVIGSMIAMLTLNFKLGIAVILILPAMIFAFQKLMSRITKLFGAGQKARDAINQSIDENIKGAMLVRVFVAEELEEKKFKKRNSKSRSIAVKIVSAFSWMVPIVNLANFVAIIIVLQLGGTEVINGNIQLGDLLAFYQYVTLFIYPIISIGFISTSISQTFVSAQRISDVMESTVNFKDGKENFNEFMSLKVKDLSLDISKEQKDLLKEIDFEVRKGEKIGIVGITGSGKSIFLQALLRFIEPTKGEIKLNNTNIKEFNIHSWRSKVGLVFQENFLFSGTIRDNIVFGRKDLGEDYLKKIAKIAEVEEFVERFPGKFNELVGERGVTLSGGQKQRVTLARALYGNPQLLILDDSTSRLDIETEKRIFANLKEEYPNLTIIIVAQKIVSVKDSNQIYVFDNGSIETKGTHSELVKKSFIYQEIELSQSNIANH